MEHDTYYYEDDHAGPEAPRHASQYQVLQPQFRQPSRPVSTRDRYRASQHGNTADDDVEDDAMQFDSFDDRLLQQLQYDRRHQADQGRARLSLAPGPSKFASNAAPSQSQSTYQHRGHAVYDDRVQRQTHPEPEQAFRNQQSHFAYTANPHLESSSDVQLGPSSFSALKAGQRRAEHSATHVVQRAARASVFEDEHQYAEEQHNHGSSNAFQQLALSRSQIVDQDEHMMHQRTATARPLQQGSSLREQPKLMNLPHAPPMCQGIQLVPVSTLPDRLRTVFPYPTFNAVQSKCFDQIFRSDNNFVLASPTGSGKTVILELAICRAVATNATGQYKIIYQAPTKALCAERQRDWEAKFTPIGLKCAELTGDSDARDLQNVQSANIIITTPEKWDSITRKWKDHEKLMKLIKVFLIDEVHILKEDRGAVLEAVVSRMKSIGTDVRFVALSATVPNFHDVAAWLGKNSSTPYEPAANEKFGEEFRPVKLQKHVCGFVSHISNDFGFEKVLDAKLPEVIAKYSEGKPLMVFCATRASCVNTARLIASWWISKSGRDRLWNPPSKQILLLNKDLRDTVASGVAFHHAGLELDDRSQVEKGFLARDINVICCTSTLAVGVNLPCHTVIIKNTVTYNGEGLQEYSDLEMMQMLGRAGRPQYDDSAVAVIMTRQNKAHRYEMMVTGQDLLESKLHSNLIDHMNAEIGLGTIRDLETARKWLTGTFLYVRLQQNADHYKIEGARSGQRIEEQVDDICFRDIALLREHNLVTGEEYFRCTEFGHAMARYYVHFETMKVFIGIQPKASPSEILSAIAQAAEFSQLRFRAGEKPFYKLLNKSPSIRFTIPVNLDLPAHKVSLIIQSVLGAADVSWDGDMAKHKSQYKTESAVVFKHISSLIRCIIDCQIYLGDSVSIHSALMLERSLGSGVWDESPLQMKQIEGIGVVSVRKLVNGGIRNMQDLEACDAQRIQALVGRNPPFGLQVLEKVKEFPKLRISLHAQASSVMKTSDGVKLQVKADIGFLNDKPPHRFAGKLVYVCILAETSDGRKMHFARISGQKLDSGQSLVFSALLTSHDQSLNCYVMCDSIAGSMRGATVKPQIAASMFPAPKPTEPDTPQQPNTSRRRAETVKPTRKRSTTSDDFGDDGLDDEALMKAGVADLEFEHIENFANPTDAITRKNTAKNKPAKGKTIVKPTSMATEADVQEPVQLANGKWACNHKCKDRIACKHLCCKEGLDKPPKKSAAKPVVLGETRAQPSQVVSTQKPKETQTRLQLTASKRKTSTFIEEIDLTQEEKKKKINYAATGPMDYRELHQLHTTIQKTDLPSTLHSIMHKKPEYCYSQGGEHALSFMDQYRNERPGTTSDYGDVSADDFASHFEPIQKHPSAQDIVPLSNGLYEDALDDYPATAPVASRGSDTFGDDDSLLGDAMIGLADSQNLQKMDRSYDDVMGPLEDALNDEFEAGFQDDDFPMDIDFTVGDNSSWDGKDGARAMTPASASKPAVQRPRAPFFDSSSSRKSQHNSFKPARIILEDPEITKLTQPKVADGTSRQLSSDKAIVISDFEVLDLANMFDDAPLEDKPVPKAFEGLEPWLFQEFGDIVEIVEE